jgi:hypothetical protein
VKNDEGFCLSLPLFLQKALFPFMNCAECHHSEEGDQGELFDGYGETSGYYDESICNLYV